MTEAHRDAQALCPVMMCFGLWEPGQLKRIQEGGTSGFWILPQIDKLLQVDHALSGWTAVGSIRRVQLTATQTAGGSRGLCPDSTSPIPLGDTGKQEP